MRARKWRRPFLPLLAAILLWGCAPQTKIPGVINQTSTINALLEGVCDGAVSIGTLKGMGNLGIGTFEALDGEMVVLDGNFYRIASDGSVTLAEDAALSPFAMVTFFATDRIANMEGPISLRDLTDRLDKLIPTKNIFYAFRIRGDFSHVKTRSIPKQQKPYPGLGYAVKRQTVFEFGKLKGTIIGFRVPDYAQGINLPGYHFHFLSEDGTKGGHLLDCEISVAVAETAIIHELHMRLPLGEGFYGSRLGGDRQGELDKAEK